MRIPTSKRGSVRLIGDVFWVNGEKVFVPLSGKEVNTFLQMVNDAEKRAKRSLKLEEVRVIADYLYENGE